MIVLTVLVGSLLMLTAEARVGNSSEVEFCFESEQCLMFDLICESDDYQVRHYDSVKWVSTDEKCLFMEIAAMRAFRRLFSYITGGNSEGKKIEMTAPVVMKMVTEKKFWESATYTMSFLLPSEYQENPPQPMDRKVYIHETPDMNVYVKHYGGWMTAMEDGQQTKALSAALDSVSAKYEKEKHFGVGYNSPMTMFKRHNEVWIPVEGDPVCPGESW